MDIFYPIAGFITAWVELIRIWQSEQVNKIPAVIREAKHYFRKWASSDILIDCAERRVEVIVRLVAVSQRVDIFHDRREYRDALEK